MKLIRNHYDLQLSGFIQWSLHVVKLLGFSREVHLGSNGQGSAFLCDARAPVVGRGVGDQVRVSVEAFYERVRLVMKEKWKKLR